MPETYTGTQKAAFMFGQMIPGAAILCCVFALIIGGPSLYQRLTVPWLGSAGRADTLPGTWVGFAKTVPHSDIESYATLKDGDARSVEHPTAAVQLIARQQFNFGWGKVKGTVTLCDATGRRTSTNFEYGRVSGGSELVLDMLPMNGYATTFDGTWQPGRIAMRWSYSGDQSVIAVLNKKDGTTFDAMCSQLQR